MAEITPEGPPVHDDLAADLALGVLDGAEKTQAQRRRLSDPTFARAVEDWEARLAALAEAVPPTAAPVALWSRISQRIEAGEDADDRVAVLRRGLARWRGGAAAAAGLAACLALALAWPRPPAPSPVLTARLSASPGAAASFVAFYDPGRRTLVLSPTRAPADEGRSPELWLIPQGGAPVALGVGDFTAAVRFTATRAAHGLAAGELAVSSEPKGGSPTGQPTGPVIATGRLTQT